MADTKVSALTAAGSFLLADEIPVNEAGTSKKVTGTQMAQVFPSLSSTKSGASATYDFTTIPTTFHRLEFEFVLRDTSGTVGLSNMTMSINGDATAANYSSQNARVVGTVATAPTENIGAQPPITIVGGGSTAGFYAAGLIRFPGYFSAVTTRKNWISHSNHPIAVTTGNIGSEQSEGVYISGAVAITRVTFTPATGFDANSYMTMTVYP